MFSLGFFTISLIREDEKHAYHYSTDNSKCFMVCCHAVDPDDHLADGMTGKEDSNDKLTISPKDILSILLAAAATALCIIIDVVSKESETEPEHHTEGEV